MTRWTINADGLWWCPSIRQWVSLHERPGTVWSNAVARNHKQAMWIVERAFRAGASHISLTCRRRPRGPGASRRAKEREYDLEST